MRFKLDKRTLLFVFIFLIGLSILLYPTVSNTWNQILASRLLKSYEENVSVQSPEMVDEMLVAAETYNQRMVPKSVPDAFTIREDTRDLEYESLVNLSGDGLMGYIEIPVIEVRAPLYHYTTEEVLQKGVGHLFGSSLPVGGSGSHAVLSAHRGLPSNKLFSDLDKVVEGDRFYISVLNHMYAYEIDKIEIVEPDQTEGLALFEGKDYVTLVTCTPYGINTHRILARGYRVPYEPGEEEAVKSRNLWLNTNFMLGLVGALLGILIALIMAIKLRKQGIPIDVEQKENEEDNRKVIHLK